jgi:hypothetical protein
VVSLQQNVVRWFKLTVVYVGLASASHNAVENFNRFYMRLRIVVVLFDERRNLDGRTI